jgi:hypothetical protein
VQTLKYDLLGVKDAISGSQSRCRHRYSTYLIGLRMAQPGAPNFLWARRLPQLYLRSAEFGDRGHINGAARDELRKKEIGHGRAKEENLAVPTWAEALTPQAGHTDLC